MTSGGASNQSVGALAPILAALALALGVVALVAPMPFLRTPEPPPSTLLIPQPRAIPEVKPVVPNDWTELASPLSQLRDPIPELATAEPEQPKEDVQPSEGQAPAASTLPPLRWRYLGWIQEPHRIAALILMNDTQQRIIYAGQTVRDEFDTSGHEIQVVSINESEIVVRRDVHEERFRREPQSEAADPFVTRTMVPSSPTPSTRPGRRR